MSAETKKLMSPGDVFVAQVENFAVHTVILMATMAVRIGLRERTNELSRLPNCMHAGLPFRLDRIPTLAPPSILTLKRQYRLRYRPRPAVRSTFVVHYAEWRHPPSLPDSRVIDRSEHRAERTAVFSGPML